MQVVATAVVVNARAHGVIAHVRLVAWTLGTAAMAVTASGVDLSVASRAIEAHEHAVRPTGTIEPWASVGRIRGVWRLRRRWGHWRGRWRHKIATAVARGAVDNQQDFLSVVARQLEQRRAREAAPIELTRTEARFGRRRLGGRRGWGRRHRWRGRDPHIRQLTVAPVWLCPMGARGAGARACTTKPNDTVIPRTRNLDARARRRAQAKVGASSARHWLVGHCEVLMLRINLVAVAVLPRGQQQLEALLPLILVGRERWARRWGHERRRRRRVRDAYARREGYRWRRAWAKPVIGYGRASGHAAILCSWGSATCPGIAHEHICRAQCPPAVTHAAALAERILLRIAGSAVPTQDVIKCRLSAVDPRTRVERQGGRRR